MTPYPTVGKEGQGPLIWGGGREVTVCLRRNNESCRQISTDEGERIKKGKEHLLISERRDT